MKTAARKNIEWRFVVPIGAFYDLERRPYLVDYVVPQELHNLIKVHGREELISDIFFDPVKHVVSFKLPEVGRTLLYYENVKVHDYETARVRVTDLITNLRIRVINGKTYYLIKTEEEILSGEVRASRSKRESRNKKVH